MSATEVMPEERESVSEERISIEETVMGMKLDKAVGYDGVSVEILKAGGGLVTDLLCRLFNQCCR